MTGAAGFVGSEVVRALARRGATVFAADRPGRVENLPKLDGVEGFGLDLEATDCAARFLSKVEPEVVVHAAWYTNPADYLVSASNVSSLAMTVNLTASAIAVGVPHVLGLGTCVEYAPSNSRRREDDPVGPATPYGACKLAAFLTATQLAQQSKTRLTWARLFHLHGPGEHPSRLLPTVTRALLDGRSFDLSPGEQIRDHLHVADVGEAIADLAESPVEGVVNVCSGRAVSLRTVLTALADICGRRALLRFGARPYAPDEALYLAGDPARLRALGWRPTHNDLIEDLTEIVEHVRGQDGPII